MVTPFSQVYRPYSDINSRFTIAHASGVVFNGHVFVDVSTFSGDVIYTLGSGLATVKDGNGTFTWRLSSLTGIFTVFLQIYNNVSSVTVNTTLSVASKDRMKIKMKKFVFFQIEISMPMFVCFSKILHCLQITTVTVGSSLYKNQYLMIYEK